MSSDPSDRSDDGSGPETGSGEAPRSGPLGETFPEFIRYARKRRQKGPRQAAGAPVSAGPATGGAPAGSPDRRVLFPSRSFAIVAVLFFFGGMLIYRILDSRARPSPPPSWTTVPRQRGSAWVDLPRPSVMGQVPEAWGQLRIGMKRSDIDPAGLTAYTGADRWADAVHVPDPSRPQAYLGLSFYRDLLYRICLRLGEDSGLQAATTISAGRVAYGPARGYEYMTPGRTHAVTIFQTDSRALKLDSIKQGEDTLLYEVALVDLDRGAARERERGGR